MIKHEDKKISVRRQCKLLKVNRSQCYFTPVLIVTTNGALVERMLELHLLHPHAGYRMMKGMLTDEGFECNRKQVRSLMHKNGMRAIYPKPKTSVGNKQHKKLKYLLKDLKIIRPNQVWAIDITYIKLRNGYVYLVGIIDIFSRKIVGWRLSPFLDTEPCLDVFESALAAAVPEITNSDQGCQFTSEAWIDLLKSFGVEISMDGKGRWVDNVFIERFWRSLKYELIYLKSFETLEQLRTAITEYILFYNTKRPHQSLNYKTPEFIYSNTQAQEDLLKFIKNNEDRAALKKINDAILKKTVNVVLENIGVINQALHRQSGKFMMV